MRQLPALARRLRLALASLVRWSQQGRDARRSAQARAQFWAEVREGEREAEAGGRP